MSSIIEIAQSELESLIAKNAQVIVAFGADWCIDCRRAQPFFQKFAENDDTIVFAHCDVEKHPNVRETLNIRRIPTFIFFKNSEEIDRVVEIQTPGELKNFIERNK